MTALLDDPAPAAPPPRRPRVDPAVTGALGIWLGSRLAVAVLTVLGAWLIRDGRAGEVDGFVEVWNRWDVDLYRKIAEFGYFSPAYGDRTEAFFPGMPAAIRLVHLLVPDFYAAGLVVSLVAGAFASVGLWRLAERDGGPLDGRRAVLYLVLFPYSVFLFAGYSEALFLAFAVNAWLAGRRERWWLAGLLAAGATATRITGVVLAAGLGVLYLEQRTRDRAPGTSWWRAVLRPEVLAMAVPVLPVVGYFGYLHARTGRWDAYGVAQEEGWGRTTVAPWKGFRDTVATAFDPANGAANAWSDRAELLAFLVGLALTVLLLARRRFGEATYVGLNVALMSVSSHYGSIVRALLVWFPFFLVLAQATRRRPWLHELVVWTSAPLAAGVVLAFIKGQWIG